jgi:tetratricopeptide (TPR) repeat protein
MKPLEPPDSHHLSAALGWLELGNHLEAYEELEKIAPKLRAHPDVLEICWGIHYLAQKWEACFDTGSALVNVAPGRSQSWRHRSASLHYMKRSQEAYDLLLPALDTFPDDWSIHYDMACYACVLGNHQEARARLERAFELGEKVSFQRVRKGALAASQRIKEMALEDPDLEPLWSEIAKWVHVV